MTERQLARRKVYDAHKRAKYLAAWSGPYCTMKVARKPCGTRIVVELDTLGRVVGHCPACVRKLKGICRTCPSPVSGRVGFASYCAACYRTHRNRRPRNMKRHRAKQAQYARTYRAKKGHTPPEVLSAIRSHNAKRQWLLYRKAKWNAGTKS